MSKNIGGRTVSAKQIIPIHYDYDNSVNKAWYILRFPAGKSGGYVYELYHNHGLVGKPYKRMEPVTDNTKVDGGKYTIALKVVSQDGSEGYISPIDNEQHIYSTATQASIMGSFLKNSYRLLDKYIGTIQNKYNLEPMGLNTSATYQERIVDMKMGSTFADGTICSAIDGSVKLGEYDENTCDVILDRLPSLMSEFELLVLSNDILQPKIKDKMVGEVLPTWWDVTVNDLTALKELAKSNVAQAQESEKPQPQ